MCLDATLRSRWVGSPTLILNPVYEYSVSFLTRACQANSHARPAPENKGLTAQCSEACNSEIKTTLSGGHHSSIVFPSEITPKSMNPAWGTHGPWTLSNYDVHPMRQIEFLAHRMFVKPLP